MMKKMAMSGLILSMLFSIVLQGGCRQQAGTPEGELTGQSECKVFLAGIVPQDEPECMHYRYADNTLHLSQRNGAFNCCPGKISAAIAVNDHTITIKETEQEAGCHCLCLYDLELEIHNLPPGAYRIIVDEPYLNNEPALDFVCDLEQQSEGDFCLNRDSYPWAIAGHGQPKMR